MMERIFNNFDGKKYQFTTYFIIKDSKLFTTMNFNFEDNLQNCFYIKRLGSMSNPKIYLDIKKDNEWISKNQFIGDYVSLMNFVAKNENSFICIRGFSRSSISQFIRMVNELCGSNIKCVKFKNKISNTQHERNLLEKEQKIENLHQKLENRDEIETAKDYMKIANSVFGERRHKSREKIIKLKKK